MITRRILSEEIGERHFISLDKKYSDRNPEFNLEYRVIISDVGDYQVMRKGGFSAPTTEVYRYEIGGEILFKPLQDDASINDEWMNYALKVEYQQGEPNGTGVKPSETEGTVFHLGKSELESLCGTYFPYLGLQGKLVLATLKPLPGDTPRGAIVELVKKAMERSEIQKISKAHHSFLQVYSLA